MEVKNVAEMSEDDRLKAAKQIAMWCDINLVLSCYTAVRVLPPEEVRMLANICRGRLLERGFSAEDIDEAMSVFDMVGLEIAGHA